MRSLAVLALVGLAAPAAAAPDWTDAPTVLAAAVASIDPALRACVDGARPRTIAIVVERAPDGATRAAMPLPPVGVRGLTAEERCLLRAVPRAVVPALPPPLERVHVAVAIGAAVPAAAAFAGWTDPAATVAAVIEPDRAALAACDPRGRIVRVVVDRRRARTRIWLPAWQFHAPGGDGSTPPRERRIKACLGRVVRGWSLPVLPAAMGELHVTIPTRP